MARASAGAREIVDAYSHPYPKAHPHAYAYAAEYRYTATGRSVGDTYGDPDVAGSCDATLVRWLRPRGGRSGPGRIWSATWLGLVYRAVAAA